MQKTYQIILPQGINQNNIFHTIGNRAAVHFQNHYNNATNSLHILNLRSFVANKFVTEKYPYSLSSFIAHEALYRDGETDYIMYPSSKAFDYYNNYAFHPNSAQENLRLKKVLKFKVQNKTFENLTLGFMAVGDLESGFMKWQNPTEENIKDFKFDNLKFYS